MDGASSYLYGKLALREVDAPLPRLLQLLGALGLGEPSADGAGLLRAEVERDELPVLVEEAQLVPLLQVDGRQDAGDRFPEVVAVCGEEKWSALWILGWHTCRLEAANESLSRFGDSCSHSVQLAARGDNLLDAHGAELRLELTELLEQVVLGLGP